jgi:hypothetical protein
MENYYFVVIKEKFDDDKKTGVVCNTKDVSNLLMNLDNDKYELVKVELIELPITFEIRDFIKFDNLEYGK